MVAWVVKTPAPTPVSAASPKQPPGAAGDSVLRRRAMDLLARREHSRRELADKLRQRFPEEDTARIDAVVEKLALENLQSDRRFAEGYARARANRGYGWLHIRAGLRSRDIGEDIIRDLEWSDEQWLASAAKLIDAKLPGLENLDPGDRDYRRLHRFLLGRGFPPELVRQSLRARLLRGTE